MKKTVFILLCLTGGLHLYGQQNSEEQIAKAYMQAYSNWDFEKMSTFYHDSVRFHDPTAEAAFPNAAYKHQGKDAVKGFFSGVFNQQQPEFVRLKSNGEFSAANIFIFHSDFECILPSAWFGEGVEGKVFVSIPLDTILEIKDGKIYRHTDYGGYKIYNSQINAQLAK